MRYTLDRERSSLDINASSSIHPIHTRAAVHGWFEATIGPDGSIDERQPLGGHIELDLTGLRSGNPLIDREAERRLQVKKHPTVVGELTSLTATDALADGPGDFDVAGELTFHGVTREIRGVLHVETGPDDSLALSGETTIDVTDFRVQPPSLLLVKVHKDVTVALRAVAVPDAGA